MTAMRVRRVDRGNRGDRGNRDELARDNGPLLSGTKGTRFGLGKINWPARRGAVTAATATPNHASITKTGSFPFILAIVFEIRRGAFPPGSNASVESNYCFAAAGLSSQLSPLPFFLLRMLV